MSSLHLAPCVNQYAQDCANLWTAWLGLSGNQRQTHFETAIHQATNFMPEVDVQFGTVSGHGAFYWSSWDLACNRKYTQGHAAKHGPNITYYNFVELASTIYHETRHAEQFYRIAQALSADEIEFPVGGKKTPIIMQVTPHSLPKVKKKKFGKKGVVATIVRQFKSDAKQIADLLNIPRPVAQHAWTNRASYATWEQSARPGYASKIVASASGWNPIVDEWLGATYRKSRMNFNDAAQSASDDTTTIFGTQSSQGVRRHLYATTPEEIDAFGVEDALKDRIKHLIGVDFDTHQDKPRSNVVVFGP
jgi:hypothetical protein